jgi:hypothetical protein
MAHEHRFAVSVPAGTTSARLKGEAVLAQLTLALTE